MTQGHIDIHTHLLPGIDDGCPTVSESLACIRALLGAGYGGAFCTSHMNTEFTAVTPALVQHATRGLQAAVLRAGLRFDLWPGGELRIGENVIDWMGQHGVPTLGDSRCVLMDFWADQWPAWLGRVMQWFFDHDYQPVLAHPERLPCVWREPEGVYELQQRGVWLAGNLRPLTGEEGPEPDRLVRQLLRDRLYHFMALDLHTPSCLGSRLDGLALLRRELGAEVADFFVHTAPRRYLLASE